MRFAIRESRFEVLDGFDSAATPLLQWREVLNGVPRGDFNVLIENLSRWQEVPQGWSLPYRTRHSEYGKKL